MLDKVEFIKVMTGLAEVYDKNLSECILDIYYEIFKEYENKEFKAAVMECIKTHKYSSLPKPANILDELHEQRRYIIEDQRVNEYKNPDHAEINEKGLKKISELVKGCVRKIK